MPKKRHSAQYSKPQSTVHPSLSSSSTTTSQNDSPTVNDLISTLRAQQISQEPKPSSSTSHIMNPTLPPPIAQLLSVEENLLTRPPNHSRRRLLNGHRLPPSPAPPRSWLESPRRAPATSSAHSQTEQRPNDIGFLPGLITQSGEEHKGRKPNVRSLQEMVLRSIAKQWETICVYEKYNLSDLPARLRSDLLSYIAVHGPEEGIGWDGLRSLLMRTVADEDQEDEMGEEELADNEDVSRLDLSYSIGRSISLKHVTSLVTRTTSTTLLANQQEKEAETSWEDEVSPSRALGMPIPHLTHLSLSHPSPSSQSISWPRLLTLAKHTPALTHLSLAFWPAPTKTPNSSTTYVSHPHGARDVEYSGTGYYAHSLDGDFREAAGILRRIAANWYALVYLDLRGCGTWVPALRWDDGSGIDWDVQWRGMRQLRLGSGIDLRDESELSEIREWRESFKKASSIDAYLKTVRRKGEKIEVIRGDLLKYRQYWKAQGEQGVRKRSLLGLTDDSGSWTSSLMRLPQTPPPSTQEMAQVDTEVEALRRSVWDQ